jgi:hypothetical protein
MTKIVFWKMGAYLSILAIGTLLLITFQNCSKVDLDIASTENPLFASGELKLCLPNGFTLENVLVQNLNLAFGNNGLELDSDADGLSDASEAVYGLDPLKRMTFGKLSDRICLQFAPDGNCQTITQNCDYSTTPLGLNRCEIELLHLDTIMPHPTHGLDSDGDGIIDLFEILRGTLPNEADAHEDPDRDLITNFQELQIGSNPLMYNGGNHKNQFSIKTYRVTDTLFLPSCTSEKWRVQIDGVPFVANAKAFVDINEPTNPSYLSFSRPQNTNQILIALKLKPALGSTETLSRIYFRSNIIAPLNNSLDGFLTDFTLAGEVLR